MIKLILFFVLVSMFSFETLAKRSSHIARQTCFDLNDQLSNCDEKIREQIESKMRIASDQKFTTKMSFYADFFEGRGTKAGNCFDQSEPILAVNQNNPLAKKGDIVVISSNGRKRVGLVMDTGLMSERQRGRGLDSSRILFGSLNTVNGVQTVTPKIISSLDALTGIDISASNNKWITDQPNRVAVGKVISCLKVINNRYSLDDAITAAKLAAEKAQVASEAKDNADQAAERALQIAKDKLKIAESEASKAKKEAVKFKKIAVAAKTAADKAEDAANDAMKAAAIAAEKKVPRGSDYMTILKNASNQKGQAVVKGGPNGQ
jgi:hypothetical protein